MCITVACIFVRATVRDNISKKRGHYSVNYLTHIKLCGARRGVVVKALRCKPAGRGFDSRWCHWNFSVT